MKSFKELQEVFETNYPIQWNSYKDESNATIDFNGTRVYVKFLKQEDTHQKNAWYVEFSVPRNKDASAFEIYGVAFQAINKFITMKKPTEISFVPATMSRYKIFKRMIKKFLNTWKIEEYKYGSHVGMTISR